MAEPVLADEDDDDDLIGDVEVAEYVVLLLSITSYKLYVEQQMGDPDAKDGHIHKGINLVRLTDANYGDGLRDFFAEKLTRPVSKATVARTFRVRISNIEQLGRRALALRVALHRSTDLPDIFKEPRARRAIKISVAANVLSEPAEAFADYVTVPLRNVRIKNWIKTAQETIGSGSVIQNPVEMAAVAVVDQTQTLKTQQAAEETRTEAEDIQEAKDERTGALEQLQNDATEAARAVLETSGEDDAPPTRSEVIGIATAAAAAAKTSLSDADVPESLRGLDLEQRAAAMTDGRVLVAAGAGAGKSTTLVARVKYLVDERKVNPARILVTSFNAKAAAELKHKISEAVGKDRAQAMQVGTMHSLYQRSILKYGDAQEKTLFVGLTKPQLAGGPTATAVNRIWRKCYATVDELTGKVNDAEAPPAKAMKLAKTKWSANGISPAEALAGAVSDKEKEAARWYEMYEGLKGSIAWRPQDCADAKGVKYQYDKFITDMRTITQGGRKSVRRIGDYDDMIAVFGDILERSPDIRGRAQKAYDHVMVDECQDLNKSQSRALRLMTEQVTDGSDGKSFWMVGDPDQSIYAFRGARPEDFVALDGAAGWKTRLIRTNYRCPPEVIEAANKLIAHNKNRMNKEAIASPQRVKGEASVNASVYVDEAATALAVAREIAGRWEGGEGVPAESNAILAATNAELHSYETALLIKGVPYARKGSSSFLSSRETEAFLGYVTLAMDTDAEKAQEAFVKILNNPNRFYINDAEKLKAATDTAVNSYARRFGLSMKEVNPVAAMRDSRFRTELGKALKGPGAPDYVFDQLEILSSALTDLGMLATQEDTNTKVLFDAVLAVPGMEWKNNPKTGKLLQNPTTFRESLSASAKDIGGEESDDADDEEGDVDDQAVATSGLGNVSFLFELAKPNPDDPLDSAFPPETPQGFVAKMNRLRARSKELSYDLDKWKGGTPPPAVFLGTVHSVKGAQWPYVTVQMTKGKFPMIPRVDPDEELTPERLAEMDGELEGFRRLAYVALTRASKDLRVVAPGEYGGKPAGMSPFLGEAGLTLGENVPVPGAEAENAPKTAAVFVEDYRRDTVNDLPFVGGNNGW
jgi:superfamily I DNA/RNA helicase